MNLFHRIFFQTSRNDKVVRKDLVMKKQEKFKFVFFYLETMRQTSVKDQKKVRMCFYINKKLNMSHSFRAVACVQVRDFSGFSSKSGFNCKC